MTYPIPHNAVEAVEPIVPFEPMPAKEIAKRLDTYAPTTIKTALNYLAERGRILRRTEPNAMGHPRNLYWRTG